ESRYAMAAALRGDVDELAMRLESTRVAAAESGEVDGYALERVQSVALARLRGDRASLALEAAAHDEFGTKQAVSSALAAAVLMWIDVGDLERGRAALHRLGSIASVPRDLDWILNVTLMTSTAARLGERELVEAGHDLLTPYAGRGVVNGGAVAFAGSVD